MDVDNNMFSDSLLPSVAQGIKLPIFEGPMDLLLFLIRKNEIDIYDIPIEQVLKQYLKVLHAMKTLDLEVAGDFFVMASTLMYIKSRLLLPQKDQVRAEEEDFDDEADPRWELVEQLLQYKKLKEAATTLEGLVRSKQDFIPRAYTEANTLMEERPLKHSDSLEIWNVFNAILRRLAEKMLHGEIHDEQVTVADRMESILGRLRQEKSFMFSSMLPENPSINMIIATFLASLELCRLKQLHLKQDALFEDIQCSAWEVGDEEVSSGASQNSLEVIEVMV